MSSRTIRVAVVLILAAVLLPVLLSACPLCADAKSNTDYPGGSASLPKGFYYSILFMVVAPFAVIGGFLLRIYLARRRVPARASVETETSERAAVSLLPDARGMRP